MKHAKAKPDYVQGPFRARGKLYCFFRRPGSLRIPLPLPIGSDEFWEAYRAALADAPRIEIGAARTKPGSINALAVAYYSSTAFTALSAQVRRYRRNIIEAWRTEVGDRPVALLERRHLVARLEKVTKTHAKRSWLHALRHMMKYAIDIGMIKVDPTAAIKVKKPKSDGFLTWGEEHIEAYRARHRIGTMARLALELFLNTAQRRSDVLHMGRQHIHGGTLQFQQKKTKVRLTIPVLPEIVDALAAMPADNLTFLVREDGTQFTNSTLGKWFRDRCDEADLKGFSAHGLRKAACRRLAKSGCTPHEIASFSGHLSLAEVTRYTREVDRAKMALTAASKLGTSTVKLESPKCQTD